MGERFPKTIKSTEPHQNDQAKLGYVKCMFYVAQNEAEVSSKHPSEKIPFDK